MILAEQNYHLQEIIAIETSLFKKTWSKTQTQSELQSIINSKNWVYLKGQLVVGYIFGWIILDEFHLNNIAVHPDYFRINIRKKLIQHIVFRVIFRDIKVIL